jgi:glycosyltransferase involved in cell wall biosynthesis
MTIGIDCRLWEQTGVGRYVKNLVLNLIEIDKKNSYVLFVRTADSRIIRNQINLKFKISNFKIVATDIPWHSAKEQISFPRILEKEKLDLMHFTYFSIPVFYNKPFVVTIHDLIINHYSTGKASTKAFPIYLLKREAYKKIIKNSAQRAKKIIAVSSATKEEIIDHLGVNPSKISVIYEGVDDFDKGSKPSRVKSPFILYVGNFYPHKNVEKAVEAFAQAKIPKSSKFILVGKEDYFRQRIIDKVKKLGIGSRVEFTGQISDEDLGNYYKKATATIAPSLMEGFGLPALEAMRSECLVICSDIPSLREVCRDAAIYFNPEDLQEVKDSIEKSFTDDNSSLIEKGKKRALEFSWKKMAQEVLKIYESSISLRSS